MTSFPRLRPAGPVSLRRGGLASDSGGAVALEFALLAPVLFLLVFGGVEFGRLMWTLSALNFSVQEGARCALYNPDGNCATTTAVEAFAAAATPQLQFPASDFTATAGNACGYQVKAAYPYTFIASGLFPVNPTLTAQACFPTAAG